MDGTAPAWQRAMRARRFIAVAVVGGVALDLACGRSSLDREAPVPSADPFCHDATLAGAATPAIGFCSDGSHRAPARAPLAPRVVWSVRLPTNGGTAPFVVDDQETLFGAGFVVDAEGFTALRPQAAGSVRFLDRARRVVGREIWAHEMAIVARTSDGEVAGIVVPSRFPNWDINAPGADGSLDLSRESRGPLSRSIGGIDRIDVHGSRRFTAATGCVPLDGDHSNPAATIRLEGGGVASACEDWESAAVSVRFFDDAGAPGTTMLLPAASLASNLAQTPRGDVALATEDPTGTKLWILRPPNFETMTPLETTGAAHLAIARDGTVVVRTTHELLAITSSAAIRFRVAVPEIELPPPMGGAGAISLFVDADSTIVTWGTSLVAHALEDGSLRWSIPAPPGQSFTYVAPAREHALYAMTDDGTIMRVEDP